MIAAKRWVPAVLLAAGLTGGATSAQWNPDTPGDPAAHATAIAALKRLDPDRDATNLVRDVRTIEGLKARLSGGGRALVANVQTLNKAIEDLHAQVRQQEIVVDLSADVLFNFDRWNIKPVAEEDLQKVALIIRKKGGGKVMIGGHTDSKGSHDYNQELSERRARSVKDWLVDHGGISSDVLDTRGFGATQPVALNSHSNGSDNPEGRALNRRVQIVIQTASGS